MQAARDREQEDEVAQPNLGNPADGEGLNPLKIWGEEGPDDDGGDEEEKAHADGVPTAQEKAEGGQRSHGPMPIGRGGNGQRRGKIPAPAGLWGLFLRLLAHVHVLPNLGLSGDVFGIGKACKRRCNVPLETQKTVSLSKAQRSRRALSGCGILTG